MSALKSFGTIFALQETEFIPTAELTRLRWERRCSSDGKASIVFSQQWATCLKAHHSKERYVLGLFKSSKGSVIIGSVYLPDVSHPDVLDTYQHVLSELHRDVCDLRGRFARQACVCLGVDANVELPAHYRDRVGREEEESEGEMYYLTGEGVAGKEEAASCSAERRREETRRVMRSSLLNFMLALQLKAGNTFQRRSPTWESYSRSHRRGLTEPHAVLDYLFVPREWDVASSEQHWLYHKGGREQTSRLSDHKLLHLCARAPGAVVPWKTGARQASLVGYRLESCADELSARTTLDCRVDVVQKAVSGFPLPERMARDILDSFTQDSIDFDTAGSSYQRPPTRPPALQRLLEVRRVTPKGAPEYKPLMKKINQHRRDYRRLRLEYELPGSRRKTKHRILSIKEEEDREYWKEEILKMIKGKVEDEVVRMKNKQLVGDLRRQACASGALPTATLTLGTMMQARGRLHTRRATGEDRIPAEMLKRMPWKTLRVMHRLFERIFLGQERYPKNWRKILVSVMPKKSKITDVGDTRLLCVGNVIGKWYSMCVVTLGEAFMDSAGLFTKLGLYGFCKGRKSYEITSTLTHLGKHASKWKGAPMHTAVADVYQAFDHCTIESFHNAMKFCNIPLLIQCALLDPLTHSEMEVTCEGMSFQAGSWDRVIKTGGPEGPFAFNCIVVAMWSQTLLEWDRQSLGYEIALRPRSGEEEAIRLRYNHALWADNVVVIASSKEKLQRQMIELTDALHAWHLAWKPSSLEYIVFGEPLTWNEDQDEIDERMDLIISSNTPQFVLPHAVLQHLVPEIDGATAYRFRRKSEIVLLGTAIPCRFDMPNHHAVDHRIEEGRRSFWADIRYYRSKAIPLMNRFQRYQVNVQAVVLHGLEAQVADNVALERLKVFEGSCLTKILHTRQRPDESLNEWTHRKHERSRTAFKDKGFQPLVQRFLLKQWHFAIDVAEFAQHATTVLPQGARAWRDSRCALLSYGSLDDEWRTLTGTEMRRHMSKRRRTTFDKEDLETYKRQKQGPESVGFRTWHWPFQEFFGKRWWDSLQPSMWTEFARHTVGENLFALFQSQLKGIVRGQRDQQMEEDEEGDLERQRRLKEEEKQKEITARRLAITNMMATDWDFKQEGIGIEIVGDSLTVIKWLTGQWAVQQYGYLKRTYNIINIMGGLAEMYGVRAAANGRDLFKHEFREFNEKADRLTHEAREGHVHEYNKQFSPNTFDVWKPIAVRGNFDGGKSAEGTACGAFLDMAVIPRQCVSNSYDKVVWIEIWERAWLLEPHQTVTDAELSAAECTVHALTCLLSRFFL